MTVHPSSPELPDDWMVALHEALVADITADSPLGLDVQTIEQVKQVRSCLSLLEDLRQVNLSSGGLVTELLESTANGEAWEGPESSRIGRFEVLEELGRGGHGIVLLAYDPVLKREIALKVPRPEVLSSRELRERFLREANAAARLTHPAIVQVYELGDAGPICYIAAEYCRGRTLSQTIREDGPFRNSQAAGRLVLALAEAVEYANGRGVLHRDLKPANVLLVRTENLTASVPGSTISPDDFEPKLTDFGLAKLSDAEAEHTRTGVLLGTPAYMSPEQARGQLQNFGSATDVYGLGTILYEVLAGRAPFVGTSDVDLLRQVAESEPTPLRQIRSEISADLEAICHKCLEKDPGKRYSTAGELAADLRRYLAGEPTKARPATPIQRTWKWIRRRPTAAALIGVTSVAALLLSVGGWVAYHETRLARDDAEARQRQAEKSEAAALASDQKSLRLNYTSTMALAWRAWEHDNVEEVYRLLDRCAPQTGKEDLREFSWHYLWNMTHQFEQTLTGHLGEIYRATYSPDGKWLASCGHDRTVRVWNAETGQNVHTLSGHTQDVNGIAFSPDGRSIASVSDDGTLRVWDATAATPQAVRVGHAGRPVFSVAFSPDGETLATGGADAKIVLWNTDTWNERHPLVHHTDNVECLAYSSDGTLLASASDDKTIKLWSTSPYDLLGTLRPVGGGSVNCLSFTRNGRQLASAGRSDRRVRLWDIVSQKEMKDLGGAFGWIHAIVFCDNDRQIAVASKDGTLQLINVKEGVTRKLLGHVGRVWSVAGGPDGRQLTTAGADGTLRTWSLDSSQPQRCLTSREALTAVAYAEDGSLFFSGHDRLSLQTLAPNGEAPPEEIGGVQTLPGDFDGDGREDVFKFLDGKWTVELASEPNAPPQEFVHGEAGDLPVVGDWNGDGKDDVGVFRQGKFHLQNRFEVIALGDTSSIPVAADWDDDGRDELGVVQQDHLLIDLGLSGRPAEFRATLPTGSSPSKVTRLAKSGRLDSSFGSQGALVKSYDSSSQGTAVAVQPDGKMVVAVSDSLVVPHGPTESFQLIRLNPDGTRDASFNWTGQRTHMPGWQSGGLDVAVQPDSRIVVLEYFAKPGEPNQIKLARYLADGAIDTSFGVEGKGAVVVDYGPGANRPARIQRQADGKVLVAGAASKQGTSYSEFAVQRFNSDGSVDMTFGLDKSGLVRTALRPHSDIAFSVRQQTDGKVLLGGVSWDLNRSLAAIVRYNLDGSIDTTFGDKGMLIGCPTAAGATVYDLAIGRGGEVYAVGCLGQASGGMIAKWDASGKQDLTFGSLGWVTIPLGPIGGLLTRVAIDDLGRLIVSGYTGAGLTAKLVLMRFLEDGTLDTDFRTALLGNASFASGYHATFGLAIDAKDRPVLVGHVRAKDGYDVMVSRFLAETTAAADEQIQDSDSWPDTARIRQLITPQLINSARARAAKVVSLQNVSRMAVAPTGTFIATCNGDDKNIRVLEVPTGRLLTTLPGHHDEVFALAISPDGRLLATAGNDALVRIWNTRGWTELATLPGHAPEVTGLDFSADGQFLASAAHDGARVWRLRDYQQEGMLFGHLDLGSVKFSGNGKALATAGGDRLIKLWDVTTGKLIAALAGHSSFVSATSFSPDGRTLASCSSDGTVRLWDLFTNQELAVFREHITPATGVAFSPDGRQLSSVGATPTGQGILWTRNWR